MIGVDIKWEMRSKEYQSEDTNSTSREDQKTVDCPPDCFPVQIGSWRPKDASNKDARAISDKLAFHIPQNGINAVIPLRPFVPRAETAASPSRSARERLRFVLGALAAAY